MNIFLVQLHSMSEKFPAGREEKSELDVDLARTDSSNLEGVNPILSEARLPPQVKLPKATQVDSLSGTPIVFSNKLKSIHAKDRIQEKDRPLALQESQIANKDSKLEWVEQYEPGVYVTFTVLIGGHKGLKRVRFR